MPDYTVPDKIGRNRGRHPISGGAISELWLSRLEIGWHPADFCAEQVNRAGPAPLFPRFRFQISGESETACGGAVCAGSATGGVMCAICSFIFFIISRGVGSATWVATDHE